ncbi:MAG: amino acid permease [Halanaerobiales bacterium]
MAGISKHKLDRNIGFFAAFSIGTGTMIGAGIFVLPNIAIANAGPAVIFSFLLGGLISLATAVSMAELATGMPRAGGSYYFISRAMGPIFGTIIGLGTWLALVFKGSFALFGLADYLNYVIPIPVTYIAIAGGLILLFINYRGAENSSSLQNLIVIGLMIILGLFIIGGSFELKTDNFTPFMPYGYGSILSTTGLIFVSFLGITQLGAISEEVKNPGKNLPKAFISSVIFVTLLYIGVMVIISGLFPIEEVAGSEAPLIDAGRLIAGRPGVLALIAAGFFATVSTANAALLSSSRFPFAMGRDNLMPEWFVAIHKNFNTPFRSIATTGITMIILFLLFNVEQLAKLGSTFNILIFVLMNFSVIILRYNKKEWYEPEFRDPLYPVTQIIGIVGSLSLLPLLGILPLVFAMVVIIGGILWFKLYGRGKAIPEYNLFDMLEKEEVPVYIDEMHKKVLVSLANPEHEYDLLKLADLLGDSITGLHVIKVPPQTGLQEARHDHMSHLEKYKVDHLLEDSFVEKFDEIIGNKKYIEIFSHSVSDAIRNQAEKERSDLILMGWREKEKFHPIAGNVTEQILKSARSHVAVLKGHLPSKINKITVPFGGGANARYAFYLAKRIAAKVKAEVKLLRVVSPEIDDNDLKIIKDSIKKELENAESNINVNYEIKKRYSREDTIILEAKNCDILIMGDSNERFRSSLLGNLPRKVAINVDRTLILVRRYKPLSREGIIGTLKVNVFNK